MKSEWRNVEAAIFRWKYVHIEMVLWAIPLGRLESASVSEEFLFLTFLVKDL